MMTKARRLAPSLVLSLALCLSLTFAWPVAAQPPLRSDAPALQLLGMQPRARSLQPPARLRTELTPGMRWWLTMSTALLVGALGSLVAVERNGCQAGWRSRLVSGSVMGLGALMTAGATLRLSFGGGRRERRDRQQGLPTGNEGGEQILQHP